MHDRWKYLLNSIRGLISVFRWLFWKINCLASCFLSTKWRLVDWMKRYKFKFATLATRSSENDFAYINCMLWCMNDVHSQHFVYHHHSPDETSAREVPQHHHLGYRIYSWTSRHQYQPIWCKKNLTKDRHSTWLSDFFSFFIIPSHSLCMFVSLWLWWITFE